MYMRIKYISNNFKSFLSNTTEYISGKKYIINQYFSYDKNRLLHTFNENKLDEKSFDDAIIYMNYFGFKLLTNCVLLVIL